MAPPPPRNPPPQPPPANQAVPAKASRGKEPFVRTSACFPLCATCRGQPRTVHSFPGARLEMGSVSFVTPEKSASRRHDLRRKRDEDEGPSSFFCSRLPWAPSSTPIRDIQGCDKPSLWLPSLWSASWSKQTDLPPPDLQARIIQNVGAQCMEACGGICTLDRGRGEQRKRLRQLGSCAKIRSEIGGQSRLLPRRGTRGDHAHNVMEFLADPDGQTADCSSSSSSRPPLS